MGVDYSDGYDWEEVVPGFDARFRNNPPTEKDFKVGEMQVEYPAMVPGRNPSVAINGKRYFLSEVCMRVVDDYRRPEQGFLPRLVDGPMTLAVVIAEKTQTVLRIGDPKSGETLYRYGERSLTNNDGEVVGVA